MYLFAICLHLIEYKFYKTRDYLSIFTTMSPETREIFKK